LNNKFHTVETDDFVIAPNHFQGIVGIADVGADLRVGPCGERSRKRINGNDPTSQNIDPQ